MQSTFNGCELSIVPYTGCVEDLPAINQLYTWIHLKNSIRLTIAQDVARLNCVVAPFTGNCGIKTLQNVVVRDTTSETRLYLLQTLEKAMVVLFRAGTCVASDQASGLTETLLVDQLGWEAINVGQNINYREQHPMFLLYKTLDPNVEIPHPWIEHIHSF